MPKLDKCMFCDRSPCRCNEKKKPTPRPRTKQESKVERPAEPSRQPSALEAMRRASLRPPPTTPAQPTITIRRSDEQAELITAIKVVRSLLGAKFVDPDDETIFGAALKEKDSPQLRAHRWRTRREAARDRGQ